MLYVWKDCIVGIGLLCSSSGANRIVLQVCLVMYMYFAIKLSSSSSSSSSLRRFPGSPSMAIDSEVLQRQHFCHHGDTICLPKSSYVTTKLHGTSTCGCNNYAIFSDRAIFTFPTVGVFRQRYSDRQKALTVHVKVPRWRHCWIQ